MSLYYVRTDGNDMNTGLIDSPAGAWQTIGKAKDTMVAGDTVQVHAGVYNEWLNLSHSGVLGSVITYMAYPGETPIIDGTGIFHPSSYGGLININGSIGYTIFDGFEIKNALDTYICYGIYQGGSNNIFKNLHIHDTNYSGIISYGNNNIFDNDKLHDVCITHGNEGLTVKSASNIEVKYCTVYNTNGKEGINFKNGTSNSSIHHNHVYNIITSEGIHIDCYGIPISNIDIYNNNIHDCPRAIVCASESSPADMFNVRIYNNLLHNNNYGFTAYPMTFNKTIYVINNTFYKNDIADLVWYDAGQYQKGCLVKNNIIYGTLAGEYLIYYPDYALGGIKIDSNLFYNPAGYLSGNKYGTNFIFDKDPLFADISASDFHLLRGSPAYRGSQDDLAPYLDYDDKLRKGVPSMGAFERFRVL